MRVALDRTARRYDGGRVLVGGSPLTVFRLGPAGRRALDAIAAGHEPSPSAQPLVDRLLDTGAAHPRPAGGRFGPDDVTVVIPVHGHDPALTIAAAGAVADVLVVDDACQPAVAVAGTATVLRHDANLGPASARMTGLSATTTPLVAFLDADCEPVPGWLGPVLAHFDDDRVALAAPRIVTTASAKPGVLARYDAVRNPLDLGPLEGRVAPATRVPYVPAAAMVVRVEALASAGGFDTDMRVGEDVDLVWRLAGQGWRCRYEPGAVVRHRPRTSLAGFVRQRFAYGRSAPDLHRRHPGAVSPSIGGPWAAGAWALAALGHAATGAAMGVVPAATVRRALPPFPGRDRVALRLAGLGLVRTGAQLASAITRLWWPVALIAGLAVRRLRPPLLAAALAPALLDWTRGTGLDPARYVALRLLDDVAYGAGVWAGAVETRSAGALVPRVRAAAVGRPAPVAPAPRLRPQVGRR